MPNRLAAQSSPYLRQHQDNPVDWFPWGSEALELAKSADRPILLSIGYSACHWCHVMAHESFEDPALAAQMNQLFVNVKVDREERPDLDDVYQHAIQLLGRQGGWPLTVFLTPAGVPFFGGTYFPPQDRHGLPAFGRVLAGVAEAYRARRSEVETSGRQLLSALSGLQSAAEPAAATTSDWAVAVSRLLGRVDDEGGGFGGAPKFPNTMALEVLLRAAALSGNQRAGEAVHRALTQMANGGIHDQLGGGFHRYSVDASWTVPHFEKMLYDNALLANLYLAAHQWSGEARYRTVASDIFDYLERELTSPLGGLFSSQDADSLDPQGHLEEGAFYVWSRAQVTAVLGEGPTADAVCKHYGVALSGNFEGGDQSVLTRRDTGAVGEDLARAAQELLLARSRRPAPFRDQKILAAWNGLALSALSRGAQVLGEPTLAQRARQVASFVRRSLDLPAEPGERSGLRRSYLSEAGPTPAFAEDYALLAVGFLDLYETAFEAADLAFARRLVEVLLAESWQSEAGAMAVSTARGERLVHLPLSLYDNAVPSATSAGLEALQRLAWLTGDARYRSAAEALVAAQVKPMSQNPFGFGNLLCGLDRHLRGPVEVVLVGEPADPRTAALRSAVHQVYLPNRALVAYSPGSPPAGIDPLLWQGRETVLEPTAYICRAGTCLAPLREPAALVTALREAALRS